MTQPLRIIFAGTPDFAARHLQALIQSEHQIVGVYSQPDRPAGRGKKLKASEVKELALEHNLPVFQPQSLKNDEALAELTSLNADIMIVVAYGLILPKAILEAPRLGCLNVHGSILPRWRGAAPIQRAIWAGDEQTGVTIMQMDEGLDTGDMLHISRCPISTTETSASLYTKLANYAKKLSKEEANIDWSMSALQIERNIRSFNPWPVCFTQMGGQTVKIYQAQVVQQLGDPGQILSSDKNGVVVACGEHALCITQLQPQGKKPMAINDFLNGRSDWVTPGTILGENNE